MYKAIIFDFYGVINKHDPYGVWLKANGYKREGAFAEVAEKVDTGQITLKDYFDRLSKLSSQPADAIRKAFDDTADIDQDVVRLIAKLKGEYKLGLLSNAPSELLRPLLKHNNLEQYFDEIFISSEVGLRKPDLELFKLALERMAVPASEAIFVDDLREYIDAAGQVGIAGIQFVDGKNLASKILDIADNGFELIGGEEHREIQVVPYDSNWPTRFEAEKQKIQAALGSGAIRVDHVGSTAVPGLSAKPIIDIQVSIANPDDETTYLPQLEKQGYVLRVREKGRRMLRTPELGVHIHVCRTGSDWERRHLLFRDWLRHDKADRQAYQNLKESLAKQDWETMNHYADAKSDLIQEMTRHAEAWAKAGGWKP
jgi:HAD superfamily hydrolase (TIGR01509 family)